MYHYHDTSLNLQPANIFNSPSKPQLSSKDWCVIQSGADLTTSSESNQTLQLETIINAFHQNTYPLKHKDIKLISGPRILTFFLYLSDVEEGGETAFPTLNLAVKPKKGKALLWPSVLNHNLEAQDPSTMHEARPVIKGLKYAANSWIHLYNYEVPNLWGCTGTFDELSG